MMGHTPPFDTVGKTPPNMVNCLLIGGPYAGWKTRVPEGMKVLNINDGNEISLGRSITQVRKGLDKEQIPKGTFYMLERVTIASPTLNDVMSLVLGFVPGTKMSDAFMEVITGYCIMCRPEDYENDDAPLANVEQLTPTAPGYPGDKGDSNG